MVLVTETSSKMVSTLFQKWLTIFFVKKLEILLSSDHTILDFQYRHQQW